MFALLATVGMWAEDYSGSYYYISTSNVSHYGFYKGSNSTNYGSTSSKTSAVIFKFVKTGTDDEYYWYNCTNNKYISVDASGNLVSADSYSDTDAYKWYIIDNGDGTVKITDKANYNSGSPSNALVTLGDNGSWWGVNDLSSDTYTNKAWKLILAVEMKKSYYIGLGRGGNRYLQYSSDDNKMKQVEASTKDLSHVWYFTDEGDGVINIHPITGSAAMGYASNAGAGADKISTTNATKSFKLTPTDATNYPIAFLASGLSSTLYLSNHGGTGTANMGLYDGLADGGTRMKVEDASANAYIGATKTIGATEWKTQSNWVLGDTWNSNGPGYTGSNMWSPICLNGVTATGIEFEGWALQLSLVNSSLTATTKKIQTDGTLTIDVDHESTLDLTLTSSNNNPGTHIFNVDGALTINMGDNTWNDYSSTNNINLGTTGSFTFTASSAKTIGANPSFAINATLVDPGASYNTVVSRTLATFTNVEITTLSVNISGTDGWTLVDNKAALETQTSIGNYYFVEQASTGVVLYMYKQTAYNVADGTTVNLSEIEDYSAYEAFIVPSGATLNVDVENFDLTKISGAGTVVLDADNNSLTGSTNKSTVATGKLTINEDKTLSIGSGDGQAHSIESFTSIELAGTIRHQNSVATLNNVTVPTGKTGKIFAYDMGKTSDGFKLAGTTTLTGDLTVCNVYNFQMKVDALTGTGTLLICGTTGGTFNASATSSQENAVVNVASATTFTGKIDVNNSNATTTVQGNLVGCEIKKTSGTLNYAGNNLNGTTLDGVVLTGSSRITTSNTVNIKNLAGNNLNNTNHLYAFVGGGTINFYGTNDLTKKSDGTACNSANIGYGSSASVVIKAGANVTAGVVLNSATLSSNAPITVEETATLTAVGSTHPDNATLLIYSTNLTNNGTINLNADGRTSKVSALSGSGTLNVASGSTIEAPSVPSTMTLTGAGNVVLTSFPTATAPTLTDWTGAVEFPANASATNITGIFNAWGNANSTIKLNDISGYFSETTDPVLPTLNILSGKVLTINNGYSNYPVELSKLTGEGNLNISWTTSKDSYKLTVDVLEGFSGTLMTAKAPIIVKKLELASAPYADALLIKTSVTGEGSVTLQELFVGLQGTTDAYTWERKTVNEVEGIYVTSLDQVQLCREMAADKVAPYFNHIGTGVGKYTITLGVNNYTSIADFTDALNAWTTTSDYAEPSVTINQPTSAFYRIKSGDKYLQDVRKSDDATQRTLTDAVGAGALAETIFYLNSNTFVGYKTGYGFGFSVCMTKDTEHLNSMLFTESSEMGKYTIQTQQGSYASADWNEGYWGVDGSDLSRVDDAASGASWTIEEVTSLPVTISAAGWATFSAPVALTIPDGVTAYTATESNETLTMTA